MNMKFNKNIAKEILNADYNTACDTCEKYLEYWQNRMDDYNRKLKGCTNDDDLYLYRKQYNESRQQFKKFHTIYEIL